ncbi:hypothetical protein H6761_03615 [Candidatus Nomurabacteria bacterium]|nr:hypothetical protein [Candidatus Nomurabacteria bacterium]
MLAYKKTHVKLTLLSIVIVAALIWLAIKNQHVVSYFSPLWSENPNIADWFHSFWFWVFAIILYVFSWGIVSLPFSKNFEGNTLGFLLIGILWAIIYFPLAIKAWNWLVPHFVW